MTKNIPTPWLSDFLSLTAPPKLSAAEFTAKYLPKYVHEYRPRYGLILRMKNGRCAGVVNTGSGAKGVISKRNNRINEAYTLYLSHYESAIASNQWVSAEQAELIKAKFNKSFQ